MATLDDFIEELRADVDDFEKYWRRMNEKSPKMYPMGFPEDDEGQWWEQFIAFRSMNK